MGENPCFDVTSSFDVFLLKHLFTLISCSFKSTKTLKEVTVDPYISLFAGQLVGWLVGWLVLYLVSELVNYIVSFNSQFVSYLVGCSWIVNQRVSQLKSVKVSY